MILQIRKKKWIVLIQELVEEGLTLEVRPVFLRLEARVIGLKLSFM